MSETRQILAEAQFRAQAKSNRIEVIANVFGTINKSWIPEIIAPNALPKKVMSQFKNEGVILNQHNPSQIIAMPISMRMEGATLISEAEFHNTPFAQEMRQIALERTAKGLKVPVSVRISGKGMGFDNGEELLAYAEEQKHDMSLYDVSGIKKIEDWCFLYTELSGLPEWSLVIGTNGANSAAKATGVFSAQVSATTADNNGGEPSQSVEGEFNMNEEEKKGFIASLVEGIKGAFAQPQVQTQLPPSTITGVSAELVQQDVTKTAEYAALEARFKAQEEAHKSMLAAQNEAAIDGLIAQGKVVPASRQTLLEARLKAPEVFDAVYKEVQPLSPFGNSVSAAGLAQKSQGTESNSSFASLALDYWVKDKHDQYGIKRDSVQARF